MINKINININNETNNTIMTILTGSYMTMMTMTMNIGIAIYRTQMVIPMTTIQHRVYIENINCLNKYWRIRLILHLILTNQMLNNNMNSQILLKIRSKIIRTYQN